MVISPIMKMKLEFDEVSQIIKRIAIVSSQLYYMREDVPELVKWVSDVLCTMRNTLALSRFLSDIRTPFEEEDEVDLEIQEGEGTNRGMRKAIARRNTIFVQGMGERTRADMFYQRIASLVKSDDMDSLLNKEFEKLVDWFSKFSEK